MKKLSFVFALVGSIFLAPSFAEACGSGTCSFEYCRVREYTRNYQNGDIGIALEPQSSQPSTCSMDDGTFYQVSGSGGAADLLLKALTTAIATRDLVSLNATNKSINWIRFRRK